MLLVASALRKDSIEATDGRIGTVNDFLFDDWTWNSSPPWEPTVRIDEAYEKQLHGHYGWPGHGFV